MTAQDGDGLRALERAAARLRAASGDAARRGVALGDLDGVYRYVRHEQRAAYEAAGWAFAADLGPTHGAWSVLMRWAGEGPGFLPESSPAPADKSGFEFLPFDALGAVNAVFRHGAGKHGACFDSDVARRRVDDVNAALRHLGRWLCGAAADEESRRSHLAHAAARVLIALACEMRGVGVDGRIAPPERGLPGNSEAGRAP